MLSVMTECVFLNRAMTSARPTAASAAATAITNKTMICPEVSLNPREKTTKSRFTALSTISTDINTTMRLRRETMPMMPIAKTIASKAR